MLEYSLPGDFTSERALRAFHFRLGCRKGLSEALRAIQSSWTGCCRATQLGSPWWVDRGVRPGQRRLATSGKEKGLRYFNHIRKSSLSIEPLNKPTYIWKIDTSTTLQRLDYPLSHLTNLTKDMHINLNMPKLLIISSSLSVVPLSKLTSSP